MTKDRKKYLDNLWMNTEVGKWARARAEDRIDDANKILEEIFQKGYFYPLGYLMDEEKKLCMAVKKELVDDKEAKEYILRLDKHNNKLMDVMVSYEFSLIDLYYHGIK